MTSRITSYKALEKQFLHKAKGKKKDRVADLLNLYKDGKIFSKITAQRELHRYLGRFKNEGEREVFFPNDDQASWGTAFDGQTQRKTIEREGRQIRPSVEDRRKEDESKIYS
jgi:hypothetical protein